MAEESAVRPIRWGVLGLGWFGEIHAETLATTPGVELAAVCTRRPGRLAEIADRHGVSRRYTDYHEMIADETLDVIGIVTHIHDHRDIAVDVLRAGKNVFLEKPMASDVAECDAIIEAAEAGGGIFMVGHICRFDPRVAMAKEAIDQGRIGKIISMHARRNLSKVIGAQVCDSISALFGDGIHDADLMLWFNGAKPVSVYGQEIHPGACKYADGGWAMIRFDNDAVGVVESVWYLPESTPYTIDARMEIIGTEGALYINCGEAGLEIHDGARVQMPDTVYWPEVFGRRYGVLKEEFRYFADCVREGRQPERTGPAESRAAVAVMNAAEESARSGKVMAL